MKMEIKETMETMKIIGVIYYGFKTIPKDKV